MARRESADTAPNPRHREDSGPATPDADAIRATWAVPARLRTLRAPSDPVAPGTRAARRDARRGHRRSECVRSLVAASTALLCRGPPRQTQPAGRDAQ